MKLFRLIFALCIVWIISNAASPVRAASDISVLAQADHEIALIFKAGNLLATFEGDSRAAVVAISPRFRDAELWHSHVTANGGLPDLSPDDLYVAFRNNLKRMCAVSVEMTCCAERVGLRWTALTRAETRKMTAEIYKAIAGQDRETQKRIHHAIIAADAAARGYAYVCW